MTTDKNDKGAIRDIRKDVERREKAISPPPASNAPKPATAGDQSQKPKYISDKGWSR